MLLLPLCAEAPLGNAPVIRRWWTLLRFNSCAAVPTPTWALTRRSTKTAPVMFGACQNLMAIVMTWTSTRGSVFSRTAGVSGGVQKEFQTLTFLFRLPTAELVFSRLCLPFVMIMPIELQGGCAPWKRCSTIASLGPAACTTVKRCGPQAWAPSLSHCQVQGTRIQQHGIEKIQDFSQRHLADLWIKNGL